MDQPIAHHSSRPGVLTRSQFSKGGSDENTIMDQVNRSVDDDPVENTLPSDMVSRQNVGTLQERCHSDSALNANESEVNDQFETIRRENAKLKLEILDVSNQLKATEDSLHEAEQDLAYTKMELMDAMKKVVDSRKENIELEKHLNDANIQTRNLERECRQVKHEHEIVSHELEKLRVENSYLKSEMKQRQDTGVGNRASTDSQNNSAVQNGVEVHRYDYGHGYSGSIQREFYDTRGYLQASSNRGNTSSNYGNTDSYQTPEIQVPVSHTRDSVGNSHPDEPKFRLPYFNGKTDFQSFWAIFEIGIRKFKWDGEKQVEHLMCSLKDDALAFVTKLPAQTRGNIRTLYSALDQRYGDYLLPEQYRENLNQVKKNARETLVEFASRVEEMVNKAYPQLNPPELVSTLTIENVLRGLPDQTLSYEVRTKCPKTIDETLRLITWHECCKNGSKRQANIRLIEEDQSENHIFDSEIRKVSHGNKYVTEDKFTEMNKQIVSEISKLSSELKQINKGNNENISGNNAKKPRFSDLTCYCCHEKGHTSRVCPAKKMKRGNSSQNQDENRGKDNNGNPSNKKGNTLDSENKPLK